MAAVRKSIMMSTGSSAHLRAALDTGIDQLRHAAAGADRAEAG
ncbi:hypothetical protein [Streptomyces cyaneofuscatus]